MSPRPSTVCASAVTPSPGWTRPASPGEPSTPGASGRGSSPASTSRNPHTSNGYAFLKVFQRTGDELWLERARRFAVHALEQVRQLREGRGRHSLFTWDVGTALFAGDCLAGTPRYPVLDGL